MDSWGIAPLIVNNGTRWRCVESFTPWPLHPREVIPVFTEYTRIRYCRIYPKIHRDMCRAYIVTQMLSSCPKRQVSDRIIPTLNVCTRKTFHIYKFSRSFAVGAQQIRHHTLKLKFIKAQFNIITLPHKRLLYACSPTQNRIIFSSLPFQSHYRLSHLP